MKAAIFLAGYYSDVYVVPDYVANLQNHTLPPTRLPQQYVMMFWRELYFLTGAFGFEMIGSPSLDLTHAGNTSLAGHMNGMKGLFFFASLAQFLIRDGSGEGECLCKLIIVSNGSCADRLSF